MLLEMLKICLQGIAYIFLPLFFLIDFVVAAIYKKVELSLALSADLYYQHQSLVSHKLSPIHPPHSFFSLVYYLGVNIVFFISPFFSFSLYKFLH